MAYIFLYVDDIILITSSHDLRKSIITLFTSEFAIKELNLLSYFLDIVVTRHADVVCGQARDLHVPSRHQITVIFIKDLSQFLLMIFKPI
jgi:hypothetical protein